MNKILFWVIASLVILGIASAGMSAYAVFRLSSLSVDKPAIYLYPEEDSQISVKLNIKGDIVTSIPEYIDGWNVFVTKEGLIENRYDYLFYENTIYNKELPDKGWVIKQSELYNWFELNLPKLGLNEKEKIQFKEYWLFRLIDAEYYEIKLLDKDFLDENMDLIISPEPDSEIRVIFYFRPVKNYFEIENPEIVTPDRIGFTVVEWGGILDE